MVKFDLPEKRGGGLLARFRGGRGGSSTPTRSKKQRGGGSGRFFGGNASKSSDFANCLDDRDGSPTVVSPESAVSTENRINDNQPAGSRVISRNQSNNPRTQKIRKRSKLPWREEVMLDKAPTAREAAFGGPPRYDWIDIVSLFSSCFHPS